MTREVAYVMAAIGDGRRVRGFRFGQAWYDGRERGAWRAMHKKFTLPPGTSFADVYKVHVAPKPLDVRKCGQ